MSRLVEQLLDMSRLDAASIRVSPESLALKAELEQIVKASALVSEGDIAIDVPDDLAVTADRAVLERVVGNLVSNAVRHGAPPVRISAELRDSHLCISVADSGEGIDPAFAPYLFDPFQRSDTARQSGTGAGLGLSIARLYARAHGGDLLYDPEFEGARFELVLPT
jgi:two-component system sensor histidine kinase MtrB